MKKSYKIAAAIIIPIALIFVYAFYVQAIWQPPLLPEFKLYSGESIQETFTLTNTKSVAVPDIDYSDGYFSYASKVWMVLDTDANIVHKGIEEEITEPLDPGATTTISIAWTVPNDLPDGIYVITSTLAESSYRFDKASGTWVREEDLDIDIQGKEYALGPIPPPPPRPDIWQVIGNLWQSFWDWMRNLWPF